MLPKLICCLMFNFMLVQARPGTGSAPWPFNLDQSFPFPTRSPINIKTSDFKLTSAPTFLNLYLCNQETWVITNTGNSLIVTREPDLLSNQFRSLSFVSGGFLEPCTYSFLIAEKFWSDHHYEILPATRVDGLGTPLQVRVTFINNKYSNMNEACKYRDGLVVIVFDVGISLTPNILFEELGDDLVNIREPGASCKGPAITFYAYLLSTLAYTPYYTYPGAYFGSGVDNELSCQAATVIHLPVKDRASISVDQFNKLLQLRNRAGRTYSNPTPPLQNAKCTPKVCGTELSLNINLGR